MKVVRKYTSAARLAAGAPILQIIGPGRERLYIVFNGEPDQVAVSSTEVSLLRKGLYCGQINLRHLDRLGNANYAEATKPSPHGAWADEEDSANGEEETVTN